jgi:ankyrin repeat protein
MDHSELIQEMVLLEKMTAQERLKHARRRRQQQLKNWANREGISGGSTASIANGTTTKSIKSHTKTKKSSVKFSENVVLLEGNYFLFLHDERMYVIENLLLLFIATARQDIDEVRNLLQSGKYNPNTANDDGLTPIHQCSIDNSEKLLRLLIEYGGDVNAKDRDLHLKISG